MPRTPAVMVQGTGSNVGKSLIVAGLCRLFARRGLKVRPFKPQNMSNNAAATDEGGEIGRAQALQARAAGVRPSVHMNPVLLKPESDTGSQIVLQGRRLGTLRAGEFGARKGELLPAVLDSFTRVSEGADLVLVEGAGSPAEVNLRAGDIANMGFAEAADVPVILVGDIDRGGVIASLVGTHAVLGEADSRRIKAFLINRFRGDAGLLAQALETISQRTGWNCLGVVPHLPAAARLPAEDALDLARPPIEARAVGRPFRVVVPVISRIANFDDLDPLRLEPGVSVDFIGPGRPLPPDADLVLLPGSKSVISDLERLRGEGWDIDILAHVRRGGTVLGICGGYQMLGRTITDADGVEGRAGTHRGLGLLDVETELVPDKRVRPVTGRSLAGRATSAAEPVSGYEIHLGRTTGPDAGRPMLIVEGQPDGAVSADGRVMGTYVHGLFRSDAFRRAFLAFRGAEASNVAYEAIIEATLDGLAAQLAEHLDVAAIWRIAQDR